MKVKQNEQAYRSIWRVFADHEGDAPKAAALTVDSI
jgi:hypothetical protein